MGARSSTLGLLRWLRLAPARLPWAMPGCPGVGAQQRGRNPAQGPEIRLARGRPHLARPRALTGPAAVHIEQHRAGCEPSIWCQGPVATTALRKTGLHLKTACFLAAWLSTWMPCRLVPSPSTMPVRLSCRAAQGRGGSWGPGAHSRWVGAISAREGLKLERGSCPAAGHAAWILEEARSNCLPDKQHQLVNSTDKRADRTSAARKVWSSLRSALASSG